MDFRVSVLCWAIALVTVEGRQFYKTDLSSKPEIGDQSTEKTESFGFVHPLDFSTFTSQFFAGSQAHLESLPSFAEFDFFGAESKQQRSFAFPSFEADKQGTNGFANPIRVQSSFDGQGSASDSYYSRHVRPPTPAEDFSPVPGRPQRRRNSHKEQFPGKSNYPSPRPGHKSEHSPTPDFANSEDVEVFYPRDRLVVLPTINGRPKPYDGYIAASDVAIRRQKGRPHQSTQIPPLVRGNDRGTQQFYPRRAGPAVAESQNQEETEEEEDEESQALEEENEDEEDDESPDKSGFRYEYDELKIPDLVIKRYPYEKIKDNDREFTADYEHYRQSVPSDLEKHFGVPDYYSDKYTVAATENLAKDKNCERQENKDGKNTCYICRNPKTGGSYEQCAYEDAPTAKKVFYGSSTSSSTNPQPEKVKYRHRRSLDFFQPSWFEYFVYNDDKHLTRRAREEQPTQYGFQPFNDQSSKKKKTKKYQSGGYKKKPKQRKPREQTEEDPSAYIRTPPSYDGPKQTYEGPSSPYEGPSSPYEGPKHDDYYDRTDDRIPYDTNAPFKSTFFDNNKKENKKRPRREHDFEDYKFDDGYSAAYRFGPEFFSEYEEKKLEPIKRDIEEEYKESTEPPKVDVESFKGNVKIFKNGDVCEKKKKDNMTCMVCNNEKTGATYEQCQYTSNPKKNSYSYGAQKSFSSNKPDGGRTQRHAKADQNPEVSDKIEKKIMITKLEKKVFDDGGDEELVTSESKDVRRVVSKDLAPSASRHEEIDEEEGEGEGPAGERVEARDGIEGLDEFLGQQQKNNDNYPQADESYDEYFKRVFPEFANYGKATQSSFDPFEKLETFSENEPIEPSNEDFVDFEESAEESAEKPKRLKEKRNDLPAQFFADDEETKKDLEKAFGSFTQRDWSKCKKMVKDKLTCYSCRDKDGVQNEECMYIEASEPVKSHKAYHERKDYDPAASSIQELLNKTENITQAEQLPLDTLNPITPIKGDFEGVEVSKDVLKTSKKRGEATKQKKYPVKKYEKVEAEVKDSVGSWGDRTSTEDPSIIKILLNSTQSEAT